jgi:HEAT repeat protein
MALKLRVGLRHEDPSVRIATLKAIGALAGPSLSPAVQIMTSDKDEEVKKEAIRTLRKLKRNI